MSENLEISLSQNVEIITQPKIEETKVILDKIKLLELHCYWNNNKKVFAVVDGISFPILISEGATSDALESLIKYPIAQAVDYYIQNNKEQINGTI